MTDTPLPEPAAWMIPGDNCRENGFVDVMAWSEGEFTAPLFTRDQLLSALSAERQAREAAEKETEQLREYVNEDKADADKWRRLACIDGPANSYELWKDRAEAAEKLARLAYSSDEHHAVWKELLARAETAEARLKEADADVQRLKYENDLLAEGVGLLRERILDAEAVKPIGYLKPRAEWATTPHFVYADERAEDWQQQVFTIPVYASPPAPHVAEIPEGWRDISTAPKDGTDILLAGPMPNGWRVTEGHWTSDEECRRQIGDCGGECRCPEYEYEDPLWISWDGGFCEPWPATHWMPLPAAPHHKQEGAQG